MKKYSFNEIADMANKYYNENPMKYGEQFLDEQYQALVDFLTMLRNEEQ